MLVCTLVPPALSATPLLTPNDLGDCAGDSWASALVLVPPDPAIAVDGGALESGDQIAALSPDGDCVGLSTWEGTGTAMTVRADDPMTVAVDGLRDGEPVSLVVWDHSKGIVVPASDVTPTFESAFAPTTGFTPDGLYIVAAAKPGIEAAEEQDEAVTVGDPYPNPVADRAQIPFALSVEADVTVEVFDALGRLVAVPHDGHLSAGDHTVPFNASGLSSGVYVYRLRVEDAVYQGRLTVSR